MVRVLSKIEISARRDEAYVQYYSLVLGISQNVVLGLFLFKIGNVLEKKLELGALGLANLLLSEVWKAYFWNYVLTFLIIMLVYYSYYWFTLFYRHVLRFLDILTPTLVSLSQAILIYTADTPSVFYFALSAFYLVGFYGLYLAYALTHPENFQADDIESASKIFSRFVSHLRFSFAAVIAGSILSLIVALMNAGRTDNSVCVTLILFIPPCIYHWQEWKFVKSIFDFYDEPLGKLDLVPRWLRRCFESGTPG